MKKRYLFLMLSVWLLTASCAEKKSMTIEQIPLPPEARQTTLNGGYEAALDAAATSVSRDLKGKYAAVSDKILALGADADAAQVFDFYQKTLAAEGFTANSEFPRNGRNYELRVWQNDDGQAVATAFITPGTDAAGKPLKFLAVYSAER